MARYGRDFGRDRWSGGGGYGQGGYGGSQYGGGMSRGRYGGEYGGMGSDASFGGGSQAYGGRSGFGSGGGAYDNDFNAGGYGGYGYGGGTSQGGGWSGGQQGGYSGTESDWSRGRDLRSGGGYGYGGGSSSGGYGGGAGYTGGGYGGGGQNYGGYGGGWTGGLSTGRDTERSYGGQNLGGASNLAGGGDELRRMRAADVMTDNPECVTPETSLAEAARKMRDLDVGIIPVVESESSKRLRGVLTDRDIAIRAVAEGKDAQSTRVMEVMTTQVETCNKNDTLRDVLNVMEREQVRRVPITDREGRLVGIIAQADVATEVDSPAGQRRFAETVGDISEPGNPRGRGGWTGSGSRASQNRGGSGGGGGLMGAVRSAVNSLGGSHEGGSQRTGGGGFSAGSTQGNSDPRALNDPGSENV